MTPSFYLCPPPPTPFSLTVHCPRLGLPALHLASRFLTSPSLPFPLPSPLVPLFATLNPPLLPVPPPRAARGRWWRQRSRGQQPCAWRPPYTFLTVCRSCCVFAVHSAPTPPLVGAGKPPSSPPSAKFTVATAITTPAYSLPEPAFVCGTRHRVAQRTANHHPRFLVARLAPPVRVHAAARLQHNPRFLSRL